ncbi:MAG: J domain-containing protein [Actinobacteria bacterium]|nr:J domain-containing protein [Actinomycetota bacterium]
MADHYRVLGVARDAPTTDIRRAYLRQARRYHPDTQSGRPAHERDAAEVHMREVNAAWMVLSDPARRREYDRTLSGQQRRGGAASGAARGSGAPARERAVRDVPPSSWHPRAGDTGWMDDFGAWSAGHDDVPSESPPAPRSPRSKLLTITPPLLLALGAVLAAVGLVVASRAVVAAASACVSVAVTLFLALPLVEMRRRAR